MEWILYSPSTYTALVIISEEAEILITMLRAQKLPLVHLLTYSAPVTRKMISFGALAYYALPALPVSHTIPPWLSIELGIFSGRLYMGFEECAPLIEYVEKDSNAKRSNRVAATISFLSEWLSLRRKGQDIMHTPMGYICQGRPLNKTHAFFMARLADDKGVFKSYHASRDVDGPDGEERDDEAEWDNVDENELV